VCWPGDGADCGRVISAARAQMAATLGFHIILACLGIALPTIVLLAEFIGLRRRDETAMRLAGRWSQAMGVLCPETAGRGAYASARRAARRSYSQSRRRKMM
jgi:cytochrome d ubiquinol oxidase subunit I